MKWWLMAIVTVCAHACVPQNPTNAKEWESTRTLSLNGEEKGLCEHDNFLLRRCEY